MSPSFKFITLGCLFVLALLAFPLAKSGSAGNPKPLTSTRAPDSDTPPKKTATPAPIFTPIPITAPAPISTPAPMTAKAIRDFEMRFVKAFDEAIQTGNAVAFMTEFFAPSYIGHFVGTSDPVNWQQQLGILDAFHAGFPDFRSEIKDMIIEGNKAVLWRTVRATHTGTFNGIAATGNKLEYQEMSICIVAGGQFQECWIMPESLALWTGIGFQLIPPKK